MESRMRSWIVFTACVLAVFAAIVGVLLLSENFHEVYDMVELQDGVLDLDSQVLLDHIGTNITGEWEFYYNKWIISEDTAATSDGIVNVGDSWKNIVIDGEKISGAGYASYKITVKNMYAGDEIYVGSSNYYVPHTIYINGKRVYAIGEMSKEYSTVWTTSEIYENTYQARNDEDIEIVIEVSGSDRGGLFMPIWLHTVTHNSGTYLGLYDIITYIAVGLMIAFVVFNFLMFIGVDKIYNKKTFAFFMLCLFLRYIVGVDGQKILHQHNIVPPYYTFKIAAVIFGFLMVAVFVKMIVEYGYITWRKKETIVLGTFFTLSTAASEIFRGYSYGWVPAIIGYISLLYIVFKLAFSKS